MWHTTPYDGPVDDPACAMNLRWWLTPGFAASYRYSPDDLHWVRTMNVARLAFNGVATDFGRAVLSPLCDLTVVLSRLCDAAALIAELDDFGPMPARSFGFKARTIHPR